MGNFVRGELSPEFFILPHSLPVALWTSHRGCRYKGGLDGTALRGKIHTVLAHTVAAADVAAIRLAMVVG